MSEGERRQNLLQELHHLQADNFESLALEFFHYQAQYNLVYRRFLELVSIDKMSVECIEDIPFLPIEVFKYNDIQTGTWSAEAIFRSSGTTAVHRSRHLVRSKDFYHRHAVHSFELVYGGLDQMTILALLPNYLEAGESSLVSMVSAFMDQSGQPGNGFFLHDFEDLASSIEHCLKSGKNFMLFGVSYALLDFAEKYSIEIGERGMLMETGGMKGRKDEVSKEFLHSQLAQAFGTSNIHSEYGMTELLSQAYAGSDRVFHCSPTMEILVKELQDPLALRAPGKTGLIHVIDLLNIDTCSFIATEDLGRMTESGFEVLGRLDHSDLRGCQLLYL